MRRIIGEMITTIKKEILYFCCYDTKIKPNDINRLAQFVKTLTKRI